MRSEVVGSFSLFVKAMPYVPVNPTTSSGSNPSHRCFIGVRMIAPARKSVRETALFPPLESEGDFSSTCSW